MLFLFGLVKAFTVWGSGFESFMRPKIISRLVVNYFFYPLV